MESNPTPDNKSRPQAIFRAVGWVAGTYQPSEENVNVGVFITSDGLTVSAVVTWQFRGRLKQRYPDYATRPDLFQQAYKWTVYPKTDPLEFHLCGMKPLNTEQVNARRLDEFRVVGQIESCSDGKIIICIQPNEYSPWRFKKAKELQSFTLTLDGSLPVLAWGEIWDIKLRRVGEQLVVVAGQPYKPSDEDKAWLEQNASRKAKALAVKKVARHKADALVKAADDQAKAGAHSKADSESGVSVPQEEQASSLQAINQNEESHQKTASLTGQTEQLAEQSLGISSQNTPAQQSGSKRKSSVNATSYQSAMVRPVQQGQQKTSIPQSQHSKTGSGQIPALKSGASGGKINPQQNKPAFQVKVNDQVFSGYDSVTLNNRMLRIDGKAVAQAKMVVVIGQAQTMLADGRVTQKDNQAVLISR